MNIALVFLLVYKVWREFWLLLLLRDISNNFRKETCYMIYMFPFFFWQAIFYFLSGIDFYISNAILYKYMKCFVTINISEVCRVSSFVHSVVQTSLKFCDAQKVSHTKTVHTLFCHIELFWLAVQTGSSVQLLLTIMSLLLQK